VTPDLFHAELMRSALLVLLGGIAGALARDVTGVQKRVRRIEANVARVRYMVEQMWLDSGRKLPQDDATAG